MATVTIGTREGIKLPIRAFRRGSTLVIQSEIQGQVILRLETDIAHEVRSIADAARMAGGTYRTEATKEKPKTSVRAQVDNATKGKPSKGKRKRGKRG